MITHTKTHSLVIILILLNIAGLVACGIFFWSIKEKNEHTSALTNSVEQTLAEQDTNTSIGKILSDTEAKRQRFTSFLVNKDSLVSFLEKIEHLGDSTQTSIKVDSVNEIAAKDGMPALFGIALTAKGTWSGVYGILRSIENLPNKVSILNFSMEYVLEVDADGKQTKNSIWEGRFNITVVHSQ